ncbi:MAG: alpha-D-ribose 1-methylphosphonate 5-triphosphate diphosphatase [Synergistaceae bacterium]|jgi:alpha-D-ribose 1-methylphosphonate 5-triphosphate diphosphatase|nr:alpha-D-ribose 1-methylphosphonate 5-triphosphate diphosphatase [Synergistaceae bacterium]
MPEFISCPAIGLVNGLIVGEQKIIEKHALLIRDGLVTEIVPEEYIPSDVELIDTEGGYIAPGFIDIHTDFCEQLLQPRPTSMMNFDLALDQVERILSGQGITTVYHSLSLQNEKLQTVKKVRTLEVVEQLARKIWERRRDDGLVRHRLHARIELDNPACLNVVKDWIDKGIVHQISFMDHTPGQGQYRDLEIYKKSTMGYMDMTEEEYELWMGKQDGKEKLSLKQIEELISFAEEHHVAVASHDDDSREKIELVQSMGVRISEFPVTLDVARYAVENRLQTVLGAPNVLLGGSHSGNLSAVEAIINKAGNILCSDYFPAGLLYSVFILHRKHKIPLAECFRLVSLNPAKALMIDRDYGSLAAGKKADVLIIQAGNIPCITDVFTNGRLVAHFHQCVVSGGMPQ